MIVLVLVIMKEQLIVKIQTRAGCYDLPNDRARLS